MKAESGRLQGALEELKSRDKLIDSKLDQTPQTSRHMKNLQFSSSVKTDNHLAKSADRYIPSRNALNHNYIREIFGHKIRSAREKAALSATQSTKIQNLKKSALSNIKPQENSLKLDEFDSPTKIGLDESDILQVSEGVDTSVARNSFNSKSLDESQDMSCLNNANDDSFSVTYSSSQSTPKRSGSPCSTRSKTASKRVFHQFNEETFFGVRDDWQKRILKFKNSVFGEEKENAQFSHTPTHSIKKRRRLENRSFLIAKTALKVLDAPSILKDLTLNLLCWSTFSCCLKSDIPRDSDLLAVALENEVYLWLVALKQIHKLSAVVRKWTCPGLAERFLRDSGVDSDNTDARGDSILTDVTALLWFGGGFLAVGRDDSVMHIFSFTKFVKKCSAEGNEFKARRLVAQTHSLSLTESGGTGPVTAIAWGKRRKMLVCACSRGGVFVVKFSGSDAEVAARLGEERHVAVVMKWSPLGDFIAVGGLDGFVRIFREDDMVAAVKRKSRSERIEKVQTVMREGKRATTVMALDWCPWSSRVLVIGDSEGRLQVIELLGKALASAKVTTKSVRSGKGSVTGLGFLPQHREVISSHGGKEGALFVWSFPELTVLAELRGHVGDVLGMALNAAKTLVASAGSDESIRIWKVNETEKVKRFPVHKGVEGKERVVMLPPVLKGLR